jgi:hypothetical protein
MHGLKRCFSTQATVFIYKAGSGINANPECPAGQYLNLEIHGTNVEFAQYTFGENSPMNAHPSNHSPHKIYPMMPSYILQEQLEDGRIS